MNHMLDRPVWSALTSRHSALATGSELAKRYPPSIAPFVATASDDAESLQALQRLVVAGEDAVLLQVDDIVLPAGLVPMSTAGGVQMICVRPPEPIADERVLRLGPSDANDMLALAELTRPGPFTLRALSLGAFFGVRMGGRLVAMAGERMKQHGFTEISGVCAHPDVRGQGLARLLSTFVANEVLARGEVPYLHAYATNTAAIELYKSIGFEIRETVNVAVVRRVTAADGHG